MGTTPEVDRLAGGVVVAVGAGPATSGTSGNQASSSDSRELLDLPPGPDAGQRRTVRRLSRQAGNGRRAAWPSTPSGTQPSSVRSGPADGALPGPAPREPSASRSAQPLRPRSSGVSRTRAVRGRRARSDVTLDGDRFAAGCRAGAQLPGGLAAGAAGQVEHAAADDEARLADVIGAGVREAGRVAVQGAHDEVVAVVRGEVELAGADRRAVGSVPRPRSSRRDTVGVVVNASRRCGSARNVLTRSGAVVLLEHRRGSAAPTPGRRRARVAGSVVSRSRASATTGPRAATRGRRSC